MSASSKSSLTELGGKYVLDMQASGSTASTNVTSSSGIIYQVEIDNEQNGSAVYLKIRDNASATPSTLTSDGAGTPHYSFVAPAFTRICYTISTGAPFDAGLSMWCSTSKSVGSTSSASNPVIVKLIAS